MDLTICNNRQIYLDIIGLTFYKFSPTLQRNFFIIYYIGIVFTQFYRFQDLRSFV